MSKAPSEGDEGEEGGEGGDGKVSTARPSVEDPSLSRSRSFASPARTHERNESEIEIDFPVRGVLTVLTPPNLRYIYIYIYIYIP